MESVALMKALITDVPAGQTARCSVP